jgi:CBS domain-containing protein
VLVIQQGAVELWDESVEPAALRDIRGPGDTVGVERFLGAERWQYSAKSASEVVVYALEAAGFGAMLEQCSRAAQYVAAYQAATAELEVSGERRAAHEVTVGEVGEERGVGRCGAGTTIREAARLMEETGAMVLAVDRTDGGEALLTAGDFVAWAAAGGGSTEAAAESIGRAAAVRVGREDRVSDVVLAMAGARASAAVVGDGDEVQGMVTRASLTAAFGDHPLAILHEIDCVREAKYERGVERLRGLNERARAWMRASLEAGATDWLMSYGELVNRRMVERVAALTGQAGEGRLWCFAGAAGRQELLTAEAPLVAVIGGRVEGLAEALGECGYQGAAEAEWGSVEEWKERFRGWIGDPIRTRYFEWRAVFDLRPVWGRGEWFGALEETVREALAAEPGFLRLLAHDCLANLPPLTFFRDFVIEESGARSETLRLKKGALEPLADVGRVFGYACGRVLGATTRERFAVAGARLAGQRAVLEEAAATMRVMLYHQARAGLRLGTDGGEAPLAVLSRHDRQGLKSGFRAIHRLLEMTAEGAWLEAL